MKRLLICTIMRNARPHVEMWEKQLAALIELLKGEYRCYISVVENDSTDDTAQWLRNKQGMASWYADALKTELTWPWLTTETLGTTQYGSIWSVDRIKNLAAARQKCLDQTGDQLVTFDKIAYVEVDCQWDANWAKELILARHPLAAGLGEPDIYSGWSLRTEANPKESVFLYDTCATRQEAHHTEWRFDQEQDWRPATVIKTDLGGSDAMCLHRVWSTFNCFCVYNAKPFYTGLGHDRVKWGWVNHRFNTGQQWVEDGDYGSGWLDSDTSVLCESFRARGYNKVFLNTNCLIRHQ